MQLRVNLNLHITVIGLYQKNGRVKKFINSLPESGDTMTIERKNSSSLSKLWFKKNNGELLYFKLINQEPDAAINDEFYYPIIEIPINPNLSCKNEIKKNLDNLFPISPILYDNSTIPQFFSRGKIEITIL
ncbi:hypothetical protein KKC17_02915 [Patescibacteria group bacterium]|nr:hypothetical protein [Patescibacteria group bacterium]